MTKVKSDLLIDFDIVEKGIKGGIFHAIHQYVNASNKYMKDYDINLCGWIIFQKLHLGGFIGLKIYISLIKILLKTRMKIVIKHNYLKLKINI